MTTRARRDVATTVPCLDVDEDVAKASTLPAAFYSDPAWFRATCDRVLARTWHLVADASEVPAAGSVRPLDLLPGALSEPLLLSTDEAGATRCLSNVCTHRGNVLVSEPCAEKAIRCGYHGRRFALDGRFLAAPRFEGAAGFPSPADDLPRVPLERFDAFHFVSLAPATPFQEWIAPLADLLTGIATDRWKLDPAASRDYEVQAHWALYVDNYLEGFHIPYVHPGLVEALDVVRYETVLWPHGVLQVGTGRGDDASIALPSGHAFAGRRVAALYAWLFPATMVNVYPWGASINVVRPVAPDRTRVSFLSYVSDRTLRGAGAGADLHGVEMEDEAIVERVQRGVRSRLYDRGRYSPLEERGVHRFHRLLASLWNDPPREV